MKKVLITGAAGGMGQATVRYFLDRDYTVLAVDSSSERLEILGQHPRLHILSFDLASPEWGGLQKWISDHGDSISGLVNLAGISLGDSIQTLELEDWETSLCINATAPMRLIQICSPFMLAQGHGSIVNVSSPVALIGARKPSYAASKAALQGLTMSVARNLGKQGIRCNMLLPGTAITYMTQDWSEEKRQAIAQESFLGRLCETQEIAQVIEFLISEQSSYITGSIVDMTAGAMYGH